MQIDIIPFNESLTEFGFKPSEINAINLRIHTHIIPQLEAIQVEAKVIQRPKPKTLQAIFEIVDNIDFELSQLEDIAKGEIGEKITLLRKYIDENRVSV